MKPIRMLTRLGTATSVAGMLGMAASFAAVIAEHGGPLLRVDTRSEVSEFTTSSPTYVMLPGAQVQVVIPATGASRLIIARFTAESQCTGTGTPGRYCSARIVAVRGAATTELNPASGLDYAFDAVTSPPNTDDQWEGNAMTRSIRLNPGTYAIRVQVGIVNSATFRIDDWHLTVEQYD